MVLYSIIIPAYNEGKIILRTLEDYYREFRDRAEIIVVVNGSTDNTYVVSQKYAKGKKQIKVVNFPAAIGKGGAVIEGFKLAKGDFIGFVDADGSTSASEFSRLAQSIGNADGVIASRWVKDAHVVVPQPFERKVAGRVFNFLVRLLFQLPYHDTQCGAKLFSKKAITDILPRIGITDWAFDIDILFLLRQRGYVIVETPTVWTDRSASNLNLKNASIKMFFAVARLRLIYSPIQKYYMFFRPITTRIYRYCKSLASTYPSTKKESTRSPPGGSAS